MCGFVTFVFEQFASSEEEHQMVNMYNIAGTHSSTAAASLSMLSSNHVKLPYFSCIAAMFCHNLEKEEMYCCMVDGT